MADRTYDAQKRVRKLLFDNGIEAVMPPKKNRLELIDYDKDLYKARHLIENFFAKLKKYGAIATRFDKRAQNFLGAVYMSAAISWL